MREGCQQCTLPGKSCREDRDQGAVEPSGRPSVPRFSLRTMGLSVYAHQMPSFTYAALSVSRFACCSFCSSVAPSKNGCWHSPRNTPSRNARTMSVGVIGRFSDGTWPESDVMFGFISRIMNRFRKYDTELSETRFGPTFPNGTKSLDDRYFGTRDVFNRKPLHEIHLVRLPLVSEWGYSRHAECIKRRTSSA